LLSGSHPSDSRPARLSRGQLCGDVTGRFDGGQIVRRYVGRALECERQSSQTNPVATGLQYVPVSPDAALLTYHYSGIGKLQWNHAFSDKLAGYVRFAENFNQYIFNQPLTDPNYAGLIRPGDVALGGGNDPYGGGRASRRPAFASLYRLYRTYVYALARASYYGGASLERDNNLQAYYDLSGGLSNPGSAFDIVGRFPNLYTVVNFPVTVPSLYAGTTQQFGHLIVEPSLRFDQEKYGIPAAIGGVFRALGEPAFRGDVRLYAESGRARVLHRDLGVRSRNLRVQRFRRRPTGLGSDA
jgi:hypothetical protein